MVSFENDYCAGAHPAVLQALVDTNLVPQTGYGADDYCARAAGKILAACGRPEGQVFFLTGGTQTNKAVIAALLQPWQGVIAARTGHVASHEAGAIEATGHKVLELPGHDGRLDAAEVEAYVRGFYADANHEHMVFPGMVYISFPTEYGTLYSRAQLTALSDVCRRYGLPLYLDGARLGYGLASDACDLTLKELAQLVDAFYIGGTKVGALCGEAVVFPHGDLPPHFLNQVKRQGALLAKGRLLGVQFDALFTDGLYEAIGRHAIRLAEQVKALFLEKGYPLLLDSPTNQQFVILDNDTMQALRQRVAFSFWEVVDDTHTAVRFATSWSTTQADVEYLRSIL